MSKIDYYFRYVIIGDSSTGKTSLLDSLLNYDVSNIRQPTIGVDFGCKYFTINKKLIKTLIWDTAGLEKFRIITQSYYHKGEVVLIVYDINNRKSFDNINYWYQQIKDYCRKDIIIVLIGNKNDKDSREVSYNEGEKFANNKKILFFESSVYDKNKVFNIFYESCQLKYMELINNEIINKPNKIIKLKENKLIDYCRKFFKIIKYRVDEYTQKNY